jgi:plastocyanin
MNRNTRRLLAGVGILALAGVACGDDGNDKGAVEAPGTATQRASTEAGGSSGDGRTITIKLIAFTPTRIEVPAGGVVTWRHDDVATHTVTSGRVEQAGGAATAKPDGTFDSGNISKGQKFEFTFAEPGEFPFFCAVHPATMTGVIAVT